MPITAEHVKEAKEDPRIRRDLLSTLMPTVEIEAKAAHVRCRQPFHEFPETLSRFTLHAWNSISCYADNPRPGVSPVAHMRRRLQLEGNRICIPRKRKNEMTYSSEALENRRTHHDHTVAFEYRDMFEAASKATDVRCYAERLFLRTCIEKKKDESIDPEARVSIDALGKYFGLSRYRSRQLWGEYKENLSRLLRGDDDNVS